MRVCWLCNYFSPYTLKLFELMSKNIELTALMLGGKDENRNEEWVFNDKYSFKVELIDSNYNKTINRLARENDVLIDSMYLTKYGYKAVSAFKKNNKKVVMQADGGIAKNRGFFINAVMSHFMKRHDLFLSSGPDTNDYFKYYGVDSNKIFNYKFTSLSKQDIENNKTLCENKTKLRAELGIDDKFTLISVGQPIKRKGFDILLNSYIKTGLQGNINLYIIGGTPQNDIKRIVEDNNLNNVVFKGLMTTEELNKYYAASDSFILCTREDIWGLVIQEAMSFGLPIITSSNCVAGKHFSRLGNNTIICDVNDVDAYSKAIKKLYEDNSYLANLSSMSFNVIKDYSLENSAEDIISFLNRL